jgi:hypothetical protein
MGDTSMNNVILRYYQPNGYLYLAINGNTANYFNAGSLLNKNVMVALRCAGGACTWSVGGAGAWINANEGSTSAPNPLLQVGADPHRWSPASGNTSALFWVYGDALTDQEVAANFQSAGAALAARGHALDGYVPPSNSAPAAQSSTASIAQDRYAFAYLRATDPDGDPLTYQVLSGPSHGTLTPTSFPFHFYEPEPGFTGTDLIQFQASDGKGGLSTATVTVVVEPHDYRTTTIATTAEFHEKLRFARPGETVLLAPGVYSQPIFSTTDWGLRGTATHPIVFRALDTANPPTIENGIQLAGSSWLRFEHLRIVKPSFHNVNLYPYNGFPSHDIVFDGVYTESKQELTLAANMKVTRSDNLTVRNSTFYGWGDNAIDTIGLWGGVIEESRFLGRPGFAQRTGLQLKGDTRDVIVRNNYFLDAGERVVQIGGGTGASFFREPPSFEAQRVEVLGNRVVGGNACFSLATQSNSRVHHNTCYLPTVWIARLLNENAALQPNQNGTFDHNVFVYGSGINLEFVNVSAAGGVNVGSFTFDNNAYFQVDGNSPLLPRLPVVETNMIDQIDPEMVDAGLVTMRVGSANPVFHGVGADAVNPAL